MPRDIRDVLRDAAAEPREPFDLDRARARVRRRRQVRASAGAAALVLAVTVGSVELLSGQHPDPPNPGPTATTAARPTAGPITAFNPRPFAPPVGWTRLATPPEVRDHAATQWTGQALLMWGGSVPGNTSVPVADGYAFDAATHEWTPMPPSPLSARAYPASAWTGRQLLVWGGLSSDRPDTGQLADGAAYDPQQRSWQTLPPAPLDGRAPLSVWTGEEFIVWGTAVRREQPPRDGAAYRPATGSWRRIADAPIEVSDATAVWTGREMIVFGALLSTSNNAPATPAIGAAYDPATDKWRRLPDSALSPQASTAAWNGRELIAWDYEMAAAAYDVGANAWRPLPHLPLRAAECYPRSAAVAGSVVGEFCGAMVVYDADAGRWRDVSKANPAGPWLGMAPAGMSMFVFGLGVTGGPPRMWAYRPG